MSAGFPASPNARDNGLLHPNVVSPQGPVRALIVDDSASFRDAARSILERAGVSIIGEVSNSAAALRYYTKLNPDITLIDIGLGTESGFELAEQLHRAGLPTPPPLILMSAYAEQEIAEMIAASPAIGFVSKIDFSADAICDLLGGCRGQGWRGEFI